MKNRTIRLFLAGVVAILGLSGCGGSSSSGSLPEVDISLLHEGYSVTGTYGALHTVTYEYCNSEVTMIAEGTRVGSFSLEVNDVNMLFPNDPNDNTINEEQRYIVASIIDDGVYELTTGETYDTYDSPSPFTITNISIIDCVLLPI